MVEYGCTLSCYENKHQHDKPLGPQTGLPANNLVFCLQLVQSHLVIKLLSFTDLLRSWLLMMIQNTNGLTRLELQGHLMRRDRGSLPNFQVSHGITFFDTKALLIQTVRGLKNLAILMGWPDKAFFVEQRNAWVPPRFNLGPKKVAIMSWLYSWHGHIRRDLLNTFNKGWRFNFFGIQNLISKNWLNLQFARTEKFVSVMIKRLKHWHLCTEKMCFFGQHKKQNDYLVTDFIYYVFKGCSATVLPKIHVRIWQETQRARQMVPKQHP